MRVSVTPDENGIVSVRHRLGTQDVAVRCFLADGSGVGYLAATPITDSHVEVVTVRGSNVAWVEVEPLTRN